jgi:acetyltransferase-like isoleucine patch superfamily enzyme
MRSHDFAKDSFDLITRPIEIGDTCWIAAQAFIGPGAVLPPGTMVKAGEVVKAREKRNTNIEHRTSNIERRTSNRRSESNRLKGRPAGAMFNAEC